MHIEFPTTRALAVALLFITAPPSPAAAEGTPSCDTSDVHLLALCETYCVHLDCTGDAPDEACATVAATFLRRTGDALECAEVGR